MPPLRTTTFVAKPANTVLEAKPVDPFFILGCVFVGASLLFTLSAYGYGLITESNTAKIQGEIQNIEQDLKKYPLQDMLDFNTKMTTVQTLLRNHTFPETIFAALSSGVEKNVYYNSFSLTYSPGVGHTLVLSAIAPDYASVARQIDALKNTAYGSLFKNVEMVSLGDSQFGGKLVDVRITVAGSLRKFDLPTTVRSVGGAGNKLPAAVTAPTNLGTPSVRIDTPVPPSETTAPATTTNTSQENL